MAKEQEIQDEVEQEAADVAPDETTPEDLFGAPAKGEQVEEADQEPEQTEEPAVEAAPEDAPADQEAPEPEPAKKPVTFEVDGVHYTLDQLVQAHRQVPHYQRLYEELKAKLQESQGQQQQQQQQQPQAPLVTPDQLTAHYKPQVEQLVKDGYIEEEAAEYYPKLLSQALWLRDQMAMMGQAVGVIGQNYNETRAQSVVSDIQTRLNNHLDELASSDMPQFEPLRTREAREGFVRSLLEDEHITVGQVRDPNEITRRWLAYAQDMIASNIRAAREAAAAKQAEAERARVNAKGATTAPGRIPQPSQSKLAEAYEDIFDTPLRDLQ